MSGFRGPPSVGPNAGSRRAKKSLVGIILQGWSTETRRSPATRDAGSTQWIFPNSRAIFYAARLCPISGERTSNVEMFAGFRLSCVEGGIVEIASIHSSSSSNIGNSWK